jgi:hypothetical protein
MKARRHFLTREANQGTLRLFGFALALFSVMAPALPLGPLFAPPLMPLAVLWAAYGWANQAEPSWRSQVGLFGLGLIHDCFSGGPLGLYAILYLAAFLVGRIAASMMRSPNLASLWGGFIAMCAGLCGIAAVVAPWALDGKVGLQMFIVQCAVTALLFPLARPFFMGINKVK